MSEPLLLAGLAGALLCLAGHLPGPVHRWGPQLPGLVGMALMAAGRPSLGVCAMAVALLWSVVRARTDRRGWARTDRRGWAGVIDLAAMALLMALMTSDAGAGRTHSHTSAVAGDPTVTPAVLIVIVWITARSGEAMFRRMPDTSRAVDAVGSSGRARVYRESGTTLMIISMAAMPG